MKKEKKTHKFLTIEDVDKIEPIKLSQFVDRDDDFDPPPGAGVYECDGEIFCPSIGLRKLYSFGTRAVALGQIKTQIKEFMELNERRGSKKKCIILDLRHYELT